MVADRPRSDGPRVTTPRQGQVISQSPLHDRHLSASETANNTIDIHYIVIFVAILKGTDTRQGHTDDICNVGGGGGGNTESTGRSRGKHERGIPPVNYANFCYLVASGDI